jgi:hypothetical protein
MAATGRVSVGDDVAALRKQLAAMQEGLSALERRLKERE